MDGVYGEPSVLSVLGSSDHNMVLLSPSDNVTLDNGSVLHVSTRCTGHFEKMEFAEELSIVRWESMYQLPSCDEKFGFYHGEIDGPVLPIQDCDKTFL